MSKKKAYKSDRRYLWKKSHPWVRFVEWARRRCKDEDREGPNYDTYFAKGISCDLTAKQLEARWHQDGAASMKRPSLDRFPNCDGNYTITNVRFIEFNKNALIASGRRWKSHREAQAAAAPELSPVFT